MIPALVCPVYNRWDLAFRMLDSIDVDVERLLIVDNSTDAPDTMTGLRPFLGHRNGGRTKVWRPPYTGIGYGGAINLMVSQNPDAPWWMWVSNDVEFHPGHLATVVARMNEATGPRIVTGGFTWGAVNAELVDVVGLVDDWSFFPVYYDDNDYHYRCKLAGVEWIEDWATGSTHGDGVHGASVTIRSDPAARLANDRSFQHNARAYVAKWGGGPGHERFTTPWDSGMPVWVTRPDISGRSSRRW